MGARDAAARGWVSQGHHQLQMVKCCPTFSPSYSVIYRALIGGFSPELAPQEISGGSQNIRI